MKITEYHPKDSPYYGTSKDVEHNGKRYSVSLIGSSWNIYNIDNAPWDDFITTTRTLEEALQEIKSIEIVNDK